MAIPTALMRPLTGPQGSEPFQAELPFGPPTAGPALERAGYVEEEYLASGEVDGVAYSTAVLVRRPSAPERFSGNVVVDPLHAMGGAGEWKALHEYIVRNGLGYARITSHKSALDRLHEFDRERYGPCLIGLDPELEKIWQESTAHDGLDAWLHGKTTKEPSEVRAVLREMMRMVISETPAANGVLAQVGAALKGDAGAVFGGGRVRNLFLGGHSLTGLAVLGFISDMHADAVLDDGSPVYGGYFPSGTGATHRTSIELDASLPTIAGFDEPVAPGHTPVIHVLPEGDVALGLAGALEGGAMGGPQLVYRRDSSDAADDPYRLYEVAGITHNDGRLVPPELVPRGGPGPSRLPWRPLFGALFHLLVEWVDEGVAPPPNQLLDLDGRELRRDEHGNVVGGVRSAPLDVPVAAYRPTSDYLPEGSDLWQFGFGTEIPFTTEKLERLYGDRAGYLAAFERRLAELVEQGWFLSDDVEELRMEAATAPLP